MSVYPHQVMGGSFVIENGTIIGEDFSRDAIGSQNLFEYMIIGIKRFLRVKPIPGNDAGGVINGQVEMPDLSANPFIRSSVGLLLLSEIGMAGTTAVGIFYSDKIIMNLAHFTGSLSRFLLSFQQFLYLLFLGACNLRG